MLSGVLTVDYSRSLSEMIAGGRYEFFFAQDEINQDRFPHQGVGIVNLEFRLFQFEDVVCSDYAIEKMRNEGYKPANMATLCAFGEQFPDAQRQGPIVALGQVMWRSCSRRVVGCLGMYNRWTRGLGPSKYETDWSSGGYFLAVRPAE